MKKVIIKQIDLINFKGQRKLTVSFNESLTSICGRNATGKTTIFDAFTWLLFGKNADDKKAFNIKTLDKDGNVIPRIPHEVSAVLDVDGEEITLRKTLTERWTKKRGSAAEEFTGNEDARFYNEIPMSLKDWNEKITAICPEDTFKVSTKPLYFTSMKWDAQRAMLVAMAGDVQDEDILKDKPELKSLIETLSGKTLDEYKREIAGKKKRLKEEIEGIPQRIEERQRDFFDGNFAVLQAQLQHKQKKLAELEKEIADQSAPYQAMADAKVKLYEKKSAIELQIASLKNKADLAKFNRKSEIRQLKDTLSRMEDKYSTATSHIRTDNERLEDLRNEWKRIRSASFEIDEDKLVCPTCKRPFDAEDREAKIAEMASNFNADKVVKMKMNQDAGLNAKKLLEQHQKEADEAQEVIGKTKERLAQLEAMNEEPTGNEATELQQQLANVIAEIDKTTEPTEIDNELKGQADTLKAEIDELKGKLALRDVNEANKKRIAELEARLKKANEELAGLEGIEFDIEVYTTTRIEMLEAKINGMSGIVKWKLFADQINGGRTETCQAVVDGVPFADLNRAMQINAGIDIINTITRHCGVSAPIFIDNAESVNQLFDTDSQLIRLVVSEDNELKVVNK